MGKHVWRVITLQIIKAAEKKLSGNQQVIRVGKYLFKNIDGAYDFKSTSNMYDIYMTVLYEVPRERRERSDSENKNYLHEMNVNINITTYANKLRVNVIEMTNREKTLGTIVIFPEHLEDLSEARRRILAKVIKCLSKEFSEYDFLF